MEMEDIHQPEKPREIWVNLTGCSQLENKVNEVKKIIKEHRDFTSLSVILESIYYDLCMLRNVKCFL